MKACGLWGVIFGPWIGTSSLMLSPGGGWWHERSLSGSCVCILDVSRSLKCSHLKFYYRAALSVWKLNITAWSNGSLGDLKYFPDHLLTFLCVFVMSVCLLSPGRAAGAVTVGIPEGVKWGVEHHCHPTVSLWQLLRRREAIPTQPVGHNHPPGGRACSKCQLILL